MARGQLQSPWGGHGCQRTAGEPSATALYGAAEERLAHESPRFFAQVMSLFIDTVTTLTRVARTSSLVSKALRHF